MNDAVIFLHRDFFSVADMKLYRAAGAGSSSRQYGSAQTSRNGVG